MAREAIPIKRRGHTVTIDVLAVQTAIARGVLSEADRQTIERMLPGLCTKIEELEGKRAVSQAVTKPPRPPRR